MELLADIAVDVLTVIGYGSFTDLARTEIRSKLTEHGATQAISVLRSRLIR